MKKMGQIISEELVHRALARKVFFQTNYIIIKMIIFIYTTGFHKYFKQHNCFQEEMFLEH